MYVSRFSTEKNMNVIIADANQNDDDALAKLRNSGRK